MGKPGRVSSRRERIRPPLQKNPLLKTANLLNLMKAVRLVQPGRPLELHESPLPRVDEDDVLVRVKAAGICHSDVHYRAGKSRVHPLPLTLGHEVAGVVEAAGRNVKQFRVGDRVCLHYMATCGTCAWCVKGN